MSSQKCSRCVQHKSFDQYHATSRGLTSCCISCLDWKIAWKAKQCAAKLAETIKHEAELNSWSSDLSQGLVLVMQPSYLVNLANIIHLTEGILVPLTSCYRCRCHHCGRRVWWIHYGYWAKREWLHRLRLAKHLYTGTVSQYVLNFPFPMFG